VTYLREFGQKIGIPDVDAQILSQVMLTVLDDKWKDHLYDLDLLRNAIHYRSYGQRDPLVEYKQEAYEMFEGLMADIQGTFTERFLKVQVQADQPRRPPPPPPPVADTADALFMGSAPAAAPPPALKSSLGRLPGDRGSVPEVGRNDPCPCGSGKKYKKCHGAGR
jgi:preprotein translocase subunit SecA